MDLTDIHRALERLDAVLVAAHAALDEDPALPEARQAYLEAYAGSPQRSGASRPRRHHRWASGGSAGRPHAPGADAGQETGGRPHTGAHGG